MDVITGILSFLISFLGGVIVSDNSHFKVKHYRIKNDKIKTPFRFVLLSDLHGKQYGDNNAELRNAVLNASPDFVIVAGDMIVGNNSESIAPAMNFLKCLAGDFPVYFALGNHESRWKHSGEEYRKLLEDIKKTGAVLLDNRYTYLSEQNVCIYGLTLEKCYYDKLKKVELNKEDIIGYLGNPMKDGFRLLVAHNPEYFPAYASWGADLTVSGHLHGGIMRIPSCFAGKKKQCGQGVISPKFRLFPKYSGGKYEMKVYEDADKAFSVKDLIVSCGLGSHTLPIRVFNPGELVVADVCGKK